MTNMRKRVARSLNFRSGREIQVEHESSPMPNLMSMVALPASSSRVGPPAMVPDFAPRGCSLGM